MRTHYAALKSECYLLDDESILAATMGYIGAEKSVMSECVCDRWQGSAEYDHGRSASLLVSMWNRRCGRQKLLRSA
jgi:hypothetical protein